jgi:hypothetical protein
MNIQTEYVCMGVYVADDKDGDPDAGIRGHGKTEAEAINHLVSELIDRAAEDAFKAGQAESNRLLSEITLSRDQAYERIASALEHLRFTEDYRKTEGEYPDEAATRGSVCCAIGCLETPK